MEARQTLLLLSGCTQCGRALELREGLLLCAACGICCPFCGLAARTGCDHRIALQGYVQTRGQVVSGLKDTTPEPLWPFVDAPDAASVESLPEPLTWQGHPLGWAEVPSLGEWIRAVGALWRLHGNEIVFQTREGDPIYAYTEEPNAFVAFARECSDRLRRHASALPTPKIVCDSRVLLEGGIVARAGAWSADGRRIALVSNGRAVVYHAETGEEIRTIVPRTSEIWSVAFGQDGETLLGLRGRSRVTWRIADGAEVAREAFPSVQQTPPLQPDPLALGAEEECRWNESFSGTTEGRAGGFFARVDTGRRPTVVFGTIDGARPHSVAFPPSDSPTFRLSEDGSQLAIFSKKSVYLYATIDGSRLGGVKGRGNPEFGGRFLPGRPEFLVRWWGSWALMGPALELGSWRSQVDLDHHRDAVALRTKDAVWIRDRDDLRVLGEHPFDRAKVTEIRPNGVLMIAAAVVPDWDIPFVSWGERFGREVQVVGPIETLRLVSTRALYFARLSPDGTRLLLGGEFGALILNLPPS